MHLLGNFSSTISSGVPWGMTGKQGVHDSNRVGCVRENSQPLSRMGQ